MSRRPWVMTQEWHDVLFLHWPVRPGELREHIPSELELDLYDGLAWLGIVYFKVKGNRPRLIPPIPGMSEYLELNVRTYVTYGGKEGIHFFSLDANHPLIAKMVRTGNFLPYRKAEITMKRRGTTYSLASRCTHKGYTQETLNTEFRPIPGLLEKTPFEQWLTERYRMWTKPEDRLLRVDISHEPWQLQKVAGTVLENTMAPYLKSDFRVSPPIAHYSKRKIARFFAPVIEV